MKNCVILDLGINQDYRFKHNLYLYSARPRIKAELSKSKNKGYTRSKLGLYKI